MIFMALAVRPDDPWPPSIGVVSGFRVAGT